jgi:hypothetical protein
MAKLVVGKLLRFFDFKTAASRMPLAILIDMSLVMLMSAPADGVEQTTGSDRPAHTPPALLSASPTATSAGEAYLKSAA